MSLRCLIYSIDPGTYDPILQVLAGLGIEGEHCPEAIAAVEKVTSEPFQLVLVDWDQQQECGFILHAARDRKAAERPLTLAIVSDDASVPKAMQAGANSILRKPIQPNQAKDTLTTARDMVKARGSAARAMQAAAAAAPSAAVATKPADISPDAPEAEEAPHRGGFVRSSASTTTTLFEAASEMQTSVDEPTEPLKTLEPVAATVAKEEPAAEPPPVSNEPRGLQWYLNKRAAAAPAQAPPPPANSDKTELLGIDENPSDWKRTESNDATAEPKAVPERQERKEQKVEAELFAYIESDKPKKKEPRQPIRLGKGPISIAVALAACAIVAAPQAPWHPQIRGLWARGQKALHAWLNPQLVTPAQAPAAHENFGRAGDEYKLPVAEAIPDATTDPSQIRVTPMVDPTKKPNNNGAADPNLLPPPGNGDGVISVTPVNPADSSQTPSGQPTGTQGQAPDAGNSTQASPQAQSASAPAQPAASQPAPQAASPLPASPTPAPVVTANTSPSRPDLSRPDSSRPDSFTSSPAASAPAQAAAPKNSQPSGAPASSGPAIPSSLKSQMISLTPDAGGNKAPETALPSIEPVNVPENAERTLLTDQPAPAYPASAKSQPGTVVLQVLIDREGNVQDAKFLQGSLAFARSAIDGVKQWKFKPYVMNGRPVSVQTNLTIIFRPGQ
jgi:periplasmic protein TonB